MSGTRTTCPYCGVGCGVIVEADGTVRGDPDHPANRGRLCSKGAALAETLGTEGRLTVPRVNGRAAGWDAALDLVARRFAEAIAAAGPQSVAFYVSGQMLTEDYYVANKLMKGFIGSANIDTNSRLCMASSVAGHKRAFGTDTVPGTYADLEQADLVVLVGSNLAWCHPVLHQRLMAARRARPGMRIVTVDPRRTATAADADLHLPIAPGGDIALFNALLAEIARRGAADRNYLARHVEGFEVALAAARATDPAASGLEAGLLARFLDMWIGTERVVTLWSQGVNQSARGTDKVNAIINCHLATGRIGRPGAGPFSVTGQPNAMGGREVGGLANMLACHLDIENPAHRRAVQAHWRAPTICTAPGLRAVELFRACARGDIRALWIIGTNPAVSAPEADFVARAIAAVPFTVVSDIADTDTTALADVVLPAAGWGEKTGIVTNSERRLSLQRAFRAPPGTARPDWRIICDVAARMGWESAFSYRDTAAIFREYAALSGRAAALGRDFDISGLAGIDDAEYAAFRPRRWPVPAAGAEGAAETEDTAEGAAGGRFFAAGGFFHADGRARMLPVNDAPVNDAPADDARPAGTMTGVMTGATTGAPALRLNSGRIRDQWHTMTRTGRAARLNARDPEPFAEIHPDDARRAGLAAGDLAVLTGGAGGRAVLRAVLSRDVPRGSVFVPMHWSAANSSAGRINVLTEGRCDPVSGQPALKGARVRLERLAVRWHGFAASAVAIAPAAAYAAVARSETGWRCELAGTELPEDWEAEARRILGLGRGSASLLHDAARGVVRVAVHEGETLRGLFFAAPAPLTISRADAIARIGRDEPALSALTGLPPAGRAEGGAIVCACRGVGRETILRAIRDGAGDVAALGRVTGAGTVCGACRPELRSLLDETPQPAAAAE